MLTQRDITGHYLPLPLPKMGVAAIKALKLCAVGSLNPPPFGPSGPFVRCETHLFMEVNGSFLHPSREDGPFLASPRTSGVMLARLSCPRAFQVGWGRMGLLRVSWIVLKPVE